MRRTCPETHRRSVRHAPNRPSVDPRVNTPGRDRLQQDFIRPQHAHEQQRLRFTRTQNAWLDRDRDLWAGRQRQARDLRTASKDRTPRRPLRRIATSSARREEGPRGCRGASTISTDAASFPMSTQCARTLPGRRRSSTALKPDWLERRGQRSVFPGPAFERRSDRMAPLNRSSADRRRFARPAPLRRSAALTGESFERARICGRQFLQTPPTITTSTD